jgi:hypothetical protein
MTGIGHQRGRMRDQAIGEFDCDEADIEDDGDQERAAMVAWRRMVVMMMRAVMVVMVVICVCMRHRCSLRA